MQRLARRFWLGKGKADAPLVNVVKLSGVIAAPGPALRRGVINLERAERWLQRAFQKGGVLCPSAVAISINSPGGSAVQSDRLCSHIMHLSKSTGIPVYTFAEDVAASGGYWLMCAGDKAYAASTSLVGSIGVIGGGFGAVELLNKLGVERRIYQAGASKSLLDPFKPEKPEEVAVVSDILSDLHGSFIATVKARRGERLKLAEGEGERDSLFSGRAWTGRQAVELGLVDGVSLLPEQMREQFGPKVHLRLCSESPTASRFGGLGLWGSDSPGGQIRAPWGEAEAYRAARCALQALGDELEERQLAASTLFRV